MDTLDKKILVALQANARASLQDIGAAVGLSASPCWARIKKMEEAGVIEGYTVRLNPQALGLADSVLVMVTLDSHSDNTLEKFGEVLATIPEGGSASGLRRVRLSAAYRRQGHARLRAPAAREALQDQGHTPQPVQLCAAHAEKADLPLGV
jgi:DNA-binding Lrp family transcriptional regulator